MRDVVILFLHLIVTVLLVKHQLQILNRDRKRAPNLRAAERFIAGLCTLFMNPARVLRSAIVLKPSTLLPLHHVLAKRKYRMLFSRKRRRPPGPKGPLDSFQKILNYARTTKTKTGLQATAYLDRRHYLCGLKPTPDQIASLRLQRHETLPEWNYTIKPQL